MVLLATTSSRRSCIEYSFLAGTLALTQLCCFLYYSIDLWPRGNECSLQYCGDSICVSKTRGLSACIEQIGAFTLQLIDAVSLSSQVSGTVRQRIVVGSVIRCRVAISLPALQIHHTAMVHMRFGLCGSSQGLPSLKHCGYLATFSRGFVPMNQLAVCYLDKHR